MVRVVDVAGAGVTVPEGILDVEPGDLQKVVSIRQGVFFFLKKKRRAAGSQGAAMRHSPRRKAPDHRICWS